MANPLIRNLLDCLPDPVVVLNEARQIVLTNGKFTTIVGRTPEQVIGLRVGEAVQCVHAHDEPHGCGTTEFCKMCGAAQAMVQTITTGQRDARECRITCTGPSALDLRVLTSSLMLDGKRYVTFAVKDITDEKRRLVLERLFFHDVLNCAGALHGVMESLPELARDEAMELETAGRRMAEQLIEEVKAHRDLVLAEQGELGVQPTDLDAAELLRDVVAVYSQSSAAEGKRLVVSPATGPRRLRTAAVLVRRVIGNLIKNALEASDRGQAVTVCYTGSPAPAFTVHNTSVMPEEVRLQIFQRSFSTKAGSGRGLGTYSVKLLSEKYLGGTVSFESIPGRGTTFTVTLPSAQSSDTPESGSSFPERSEHSPSPGSGDHGVRTAAHSGPLKILFAEDSPVNQQLGARLLERRGHRVTVAGDGAAALAALKEQSFDVVLMDVQMPVMDGFAAVAAIRRQEAGTSAHLPVVAVTANAMKGDRERCLANGFDDYIAKPLDGKRLLEIVARLAPPARSPEAGAPPPAVVDRAAVLAVVEGDEDLLREVVEVFLDDLPRRIAAVGAAIDRADVSGLREAAHALKGAVGNFGPTAARDAAARLEAIGRAGQLADAKEAFATLVDALDRFRLALPDLVGTPTP